MPPISIRLEAAGSRTASRRRRLPAWLAATSAATLGAITLGMGPSARADTLPEALAYAYSYNTDLVAARAHLRVVDEQVPQALSGWRPTLSIMSSDGRQNYHIGSGALVPAPYGYQQWAYGTNIQLNQSLYAGGSRPADVARAEATVRAARADLLGTEQTVLMQAATAYDNVLRTRAILLLDREIVTLLERRLREVTLRKEAGQLTRTDIDQTANRLAAAKAALIGAEGDVAAANADFVAAVGRPPGGQMTLHGLPPNLPKDGAEAVGLAEANSPTVIASLFRLSAAQHAVTVARAALLPTLKLTAQAGVDHGETYPTAPARNASVMVNLSVPLYQGGLAASQLRQARASVSESEAQTQSSRRDARKSAEAAYANWRASMGELEQEHEQVRLADAAYQAVLKEAAVGARSTFELLGQLQELYNARNNEVQARYNVATDAYQLLVATGRFTALDLHLPTQIYDATENYRRVRNAGSPLP